MIIDSTILEMLFIDRRLWRLPHWRWRRWANTATGASKAGSMAACWWVACESLKSKVLAMLGPSMTWSKRRILMLCPGILSILMLNLMGFLWKIILSSRAKTFSFTVNWFLGQHPTDFTFVKIKARLDWSCCVCHGRRGDRILCDGCETGRSWIKVFVEWVNPNYPN